MSSGFNKYLKGSKNQRTNSNYNVDKSKFDDIGISADNSNFSPVYDTIDMVKIQKMNESLGKIEFYFKKDVKDINRISSQIQDIKEAFSLYVPGYPFMPLYRIGKWDGKFKFLQNEKYINGIYSYNMNIGMIDIFIKYLDNNLIPYEYIKFDEEDEIQKNLDRLDEFIELLNLPYKLRDYQKEGIITALKNKKCILEAATSCLDEDTKIKVIIEDDNENT